MSAKKPIRVAILGGGCGGVSAAYHLSSPELGNRFQVSLFTQGWRLGGKGASARNPDVNCRIQEHGLHVLFGFHQAVFGVLKEAYDTLADNTVLFKTVEEAFSSTRDVTLMQRVPPDKDQWEAWHFQFPQLAGKPWDEDSFSFDARVVQRIIPWIRDHLFPDFNPSGDQTGKELLDGAAQIAAEMRSLRAEDPAANLRERLIAKLRQFIEWFRNNAEAHALRRPDGFKICALIDLAIALSIGYVKDVLPFGENGFNRINGHEYKDWLHSHGADPRYLWTAPVRCLYDLGFAFDGGFPTTEQNGKIAAGVALKVTLLLCMGYKDAPLWRTNAAMGEVIFAPIYRVLEARKVEINFFHRLANLHLSPSGREISAIELIRQLKTQNYPPMVKHDQLWCWPPEPRWDFIEGGVAMKDKAWDTESVLCTYEVDRKTITAGNDFDAAILAIPPASLPYCAPELLHRSRKIARMYSELSWVSTQSVQLWLSQTVSQLGFPLGRILTSYQEPLSSWADWDQMLKVEDWGGSASSMVFLCGAFVPKIFGSPIPDRDYQVRQSQYVAEAFEEWIDLFGNTVWPNAFKGGKFDRSLIVSSYARANIDPTEQYVQSFPGSIQHRLQPYGSGIDNLYLAGDWTVTKINGGSSETAFESGQVAAEAIIQRYS